MGIVVTKALVETGDRVGKVFLGNDGGHGFLRQRPLSFPHATANLGIVRAGAILAILADAGCVSVFGIHTGARRVPILLIPRVNSLAQGFEHPKVAAPTFDVVRVDGLRVSHVFLLMQRLSLYQLKVLTQLTIPMHSSDQRRGSFSMLGKVETKAHVDSVHRAARIQKKKDVPTRVRTGDDRFKVDRANRYTIGTIPKSLLLFH